MFVEKQLPSILIWHFFKTLTGGGQNHVESSEQPARLGLQAASRRGVPAAAQAASSTQDPDKMAQLSGIWPLLSGAQLASHHWMQSCQNRPQSNTSGNRPKPQREEGAGALTSQDLTPAPLGGRALTRPPAPGSRVPANS